VIAGSDISTILRMDESITVGNCLLKRSDLFFSGLGFTSEVLCDIRALILFRLSSDLLSPPLKSLMDSVAEHWGTAMDFADFEADRVREVLYFSAQRIRFRIWFRLKNRTAFCLRCLE